MNSWKKPALELTLLIFSVTLIISGCIDGGDPVKKIEKRVNALMTAKVNGNWQEVYPFFDANYKSKIPESRFQRPRSIKILEYSIDSIQLGPEKKSANVLVIYSMMIQTGATVDNIKDKQSWILENGEWVLAAEPTFGIAG